MPPDREIPESVAEWMSFAKSDLALAKVRKRGFMRYEGLCFQAQQAAEKALKAVMILCDVAPPYIHGIDELIKLLPPDISIPPDVRAAKRLSRYAVVIEV